MCRWHTVFQIKKKYFMKNYPDKKQSQIPSYSSTGCFNEINIDN